MKISKTTQYAIRSLIFINQASRSCNTCVSLKDISKGINSPEYFTAKVLQPLAKQNLIKSIKGPGGGFCINENTGAVNLREITEIIEGKDYFKKCFLGLSGCSDEKPCPAHFQYMAIKKDAMELFERLTIETLTENLDSNNELFHLVG